MIDRYRQLFSELELLEHQLKDKCKIKFGKSIALRMTSKKKGFILPDSFKEILGGKNGRK